MLNDREKHLIATMPNTEYGQALEKLLREEISLIEDKEVYGSKICDDPLHEDFRVQLGIKIGLKMILRKPKECLTELNREEQKK